MLIYDPLIRITDSFLGDSKCGCTDDGQIQYNCPNCSPNGGSKYNLEINYKKSVYKCWSCGETDNMVGNIKSLLLKYGNKTLLHQYQEEVQSIKNSELYKIFIDNNENVFEEELEELILPINYISLSDTNKEEKNSKLKTPLEYLKERNVNNTIINHHNIGCITDTTDDYKLTNRIILPSYNKFGELNFWTGRDYGGINSQYRNKYENCDRERKNIIFNENLINWDEDIILVEGPFDHIVVPNSIPLLGKVLKKDYYLYKELIKNTKNNNIKIIIWLDGDAYRNVKYLYKILNTDHLYNRIRFIPIKKEEDPSSIYQKNGYRGISQHLKQMKKIHELDLIIKD